MNFFGTLSLYEAVRASALVPKILFVGSAYEYGVTFDDGASVNEESLLKPVNSYSARKAAADLLSCQYFLGYGLKIVRVRPFNHTGPGQSQDFVCSSFAKQIVEIEHNKIEAELHVGNLEAQRDILDVRDVVRAYRLALQKGKVGEIYNICSQKSVTIREVLAVLLNLSSEPIKVVHDLSQGRALEIAEMRGNCEKFKADTGWQVTIPLERTLEEIINYWRKVVSSSSNVSRKVKNN